MELATRTIATGFAFPECPRWHDGLLWFSDQHDCKVHVLTPDGAAVETFDVPGRPSGLGWLPDRDLLVVSMLERRLYRRRNGALSIYAELSALHPGQSNDMVVDREGRAYVGNIGFDFHAGEAFRPTAIALVTPDGTVSVAADEVACPNGSVIAPDGRTLIVAESFGMRLMEFDIAADGTLTDRRVFAELGGLVRTASAWTPRAASGWLPPMPGRRCAWRGAVRSWTRSRSPAARPMPACWAARTGGICSWPAPPAMTRMRPSRSARAASTWRGRRRRAPGCREARNGLRA